MKLFQFKSKRKKAKNLQDREFEFLFLETLNIIRSQILGSIARIDTFSKRVSIGYFKMIIQSECYLEILGSSNKSKKMIFESYRDTSLEDKKIYARCHFMDKETTIFDFFNSSDREPMLLNFIHIDEMLDLMKLALYKDFIHTKNIKAVQVYKKFILQLLDEMEHKYAYPYNEILPKLMIEITKLENKALDKGGLSST